MAVDLVVGENYSRLACQGGHFRLDSMGICKCLNDRFDENKINFYSF